MHCSDLWAGDSANFAQKMAELTDFGQLVPQIYRGFPRGSMVFFPWTSGGTAEQLDLLLSVLVELHFFEWFYSCVYACVYVCACVYACERACVSLRVSKKERKKERNCPWAQTLTLSSVV